MNNAKKLTPATEILKANNAHVLNESKEFRQARDALLAKEIKLRRHIVQVAEQRRVQQSVLDPRIIQRYLTHHLHS